MSSNDARQRAEDFFAKWNVCSNLPMLTAEQDALVIPWLAVIIGNAVAQAEADLARVRAALERVPNPVAYDTHGWFCCSMCYATSGVKRVQYTDPQPGHAVGHMEPEDANFPHKDDCAWLIVRAALEGR